MSGIRNSKTVFSWAIVAALLSNISLPIVAEDAPWQNQNASDPQAPPPTSQAAPLIKRGTSDQEEFIPLLAPVVTKKVAFSQAENVFHGRFNIRNLYQDINNGTHGAQTRAQSDGSIERLQGTPMSLVWNGLVSYRDATTFTTANDYKKPKLTMYSLALNDKLEDGGLARLGRFLPPELSGLGYIDGGQLERKASDAFRLGVAAGTRPAERDLGLSSREPVMAGYGSYQAGQPGDNYYLGTVGFFQTLFRGSADEMAMLYDQRSDFGQLLNLMVSSQIDFNVGAAQVHAESARLTHLDVYAASPISSILTLRAGTNHYELPDTAAQRDLAGSGNLTPFDGGYWRHWVGGIERLPSDFQFNEELDLIRSANDETLGQVRGTISHAGIFFLPQAILSFTAYSLNGLEGSGAGGICSAILPLYDNRINLTANAGFLYNSLTDSRKAFHMNDDSLYINWRINRTWEANLGVLQTYQGSIQSTVIDSGLSYRW